LQAFFGMQILPAGIKKRTPAPPVFPGKAGVP